MIYGAEVDHFCAEVEKTWRYRGRRDALSGVAYDALRAGCDGLQRRFATARCAGRLMLTSRAKRCWQRRASTCMLSVKSCVAYVQRATLGTTQRVAAVRARVV